MTKLVKTVIQIGVVVASLSGCTAPPASVSEVRHNKFLTNKRNILILSDVCIQRSDLSRTYFVEQESEYAANQASVSIQEFAKDSGLTIHGRYNLVCGAKITENNTISVAKKSGEKPTDEKQPVSGSLEVMRDEEFSDALSLISSYSYEQTAFAISGKPKEEYSFKVSKNDFLIAADKVREKTGGNLVIYFGSMGNQVAGSKAVAKLIGNTIVGTATAVAIGPIFTTSTSQVFVGLTPFKRDTTGRIMEGAFVSLDTGELIWSNGVQDYTKPLDEDSWNNLEYIDYLFHDLFFEKI